MANTISAYAKEYVNSQVELFRMQNTYSLTNDLVKNTISHTGKTIAYDKVSLGSGAMGDYNRATGYGSRDITVTRLEKTLSQDKGDSLMIDAMDAKEAQVEGSVIRLYNQYIIEVMLPEVDTYRLSKVGAYNQATESVNGTLTTTNVVSKLYGDLAKLKNNRIKLEGCIIYIGSSVKALLDEAAFGKGIITVGNWNGNLDTTVEKIKGAKVVEVPDDFLPANVNWVICHYLAADAFVVNTDATFFEEVPGFGSRKKEVDVGIYHDCFVTDNQLKGIVVGVTATRAA